MNDKTIDDMNRRRFSGGGYLVMFLIVLIVFIVIGYETRARELETRLEDHRAFVDGLAAVNADLEMQKAKQITSQVIDSLKMDIKADAYLEGWDAAMKKASPPTIGGVE